MKHLKLTVLFLLSTVYVTFAQEFTNIDEVGFNNDDLIAIRKADSWGFLDIKGTLVVDFRKDIVATPEAFPIFSNGLCLIKEKRESIVYYGYINRKGETIIPTEYIAAIPFKDGLASVINYNKTITGTNAFGQNVVYHTYHESIIDTKNKSVLNISEPHNLLLYKLKLQQDIPEIRSQIINEHLISVKKDDNTYCIYNLNK